MKKEPVLKLESSPYSDESTKASIEDFACENAATAGVLAAYWAGETGSLLPAASTSTAQMTDDLPRPDVHRASLFSPWGYEEAVGHACRKWRMG